MKVARIQISMSNSNGGQNENGCMCVCTNVYWSISGRHLCGHCETLVSLDKFSMN